MIAKQNKSKKINTKTYHISGEEQHRAASLQIISKFRLQVTPTRRDERHTRLANIVLGGVVARQLQCGAIAVSENDVHVLEARSNRNADDTGTAADVEHNEIGCQRRAQRRQARQLVGERQ